MERWRERGGRARERRERETGSEEGEMEREGGGER